MIRWHGAINVEFDALNPEQDGDPEQDGIVARARSAVFYEYNVAHLGGSAIGDGGNKTEIKLSFYSGYDGMELSIPADSLMTDFDDFVFYPPTPCDGDSNLPDYRVFNHFSAPVEFGFNGSPSPARAQIDLIIPLKQECVADGGASLRVAVDDPHGVRPLATLSMGASGNISVY